VVGKPFLEVKEEIEKILEGKLVIVCGGRPDFECLDLCMGEFDTFDLHSYWKKGNNTYNRHGAENMNPIGLRSLYMYYYKEDIQCGQHSALLDAKATVRLFREQYVPLHFQEREKDVDPCEFKYIKTIK
jgi:hypothetical protein